MGAVLLLTVGGSPAPLVQSLRQLRPEFAFFLCSDDGPSARGSYDQVPAIVEEAGLAPDRCEVRRIPDFDNFEACYLSAMAVIREARERFPHAQIAADYTGGTKSMTGGLAAAALDEGRCTLRLVTGVRSDLTRVREGTEFARPVQVDRIQLERTFRLIEPLVERFDYAAAAEFLEETANRFDPGDALEELNRRLNLCRAFDAWDRFELSRAADLLKPHRRYAVELAVRLDKVLAAAELLAAGGSQPARAAGYELVDDLILNAERRASQRRFDDAVARLYRALELTAQLRLRERGLDTSEIEPGLLPEEVRGELEGHRGRDGRIRLALADAWEMLARLGDDPFGTAYAARRGALIGSLEVRNKSILAHGLAPIGEAQWRAFREVVVGFLDPLLEYAHKARGVRREPVQLLKRLP